MADDVRLAVHNYFREFGHDVGEAVYGELRKSGGMARLLKKLGIPVEGTSEDQYRMLIQYFRRQGTDYFLQLTGAKPLDFKVDVVSSPENKEDDTRKRLGLRPLSGAKAARPADLANAETQRKQSNETTRPAPPPEKTQVLSGSDTTRPASSPPAHSDSSYQRKTLKPVYMNPPKKSDKSAKERVQMTTPPDEKSSGSDTGTGPGEIPPSPPESIEAPKPSSTGKPSPYDQVDQEGYPMGPLVPAPAPDPSDVNGSTPSWDSKKPWDPTGNWPEVERRSGRERRRLPDRRSEVDIVYRNRRYGGDRRDDEERRKNWPKGGHRK